MTINTKEVIFIFKRPLILLLVYCLLAISSSPASAYKTLGGGRVEVSERDITFMTPAEPVCLDNGLTIKIQRPTVHYNFFPDVDVTKYYSSGNEIGYEKTPTVTGLSLLFINSSNRVIVIRWAESAIAVHDYSGVPFLGGMLFSDAGIPAATPDTVIAPGQTVSKCVYYSTVTLQGYYSYVNGSWIPKTNDLVLTLTLKIVDGNGAYNYHTIKSPPIGIIPAS